MSWESYDMISSMDSANEDQILMVVKLLLYFLVRGQVLPQHQIFNPQWAILI